jgi:hypothetical protein
MFSRILEIQQSEYGPHDRRCFVTVDKINMVQGKGIQYDDTIEELRKTFSMPEASVPRNQQPAERSRPGSKHSKGRRETKGIKGRQGDDALSQQGSSQKKLNRKNKVLKVLNSMRKKKS